MTNKQNPTWLPLHKLPLFSHSVAGLLRDTQEMYPLFVQAKNKPWVLDDATVERTIRLYSERLDILAVDEEQLRRWKQERLTPQQQQTIASLSEQVAKTKKLVIELLEIAREIKQNTIDEILKRDDAQLALDVLTGKLKLPK